MGVSLRCPITVSHSVYVNKRSGWSIYKDEFKKDSHLVKIARCKEMR